MEGNRKDNETKALNLMRIQTALIACILIFLIILGVAAAAKVRSMQTCIDLIERNMETVDMEALNDAVDAFTDAANQFNKIDMDEFNNTVAALDGAAEGLQEVDVESLNALVSSLETVAAKLQNTVNAISGFFGR